MFERIKIENMRDVTHELFGKEELDISRYPFMTAEYRAILRSQVTAYRADGVNDLIEDYNLLTEECARDDVYLVPRNGSLKTIPVSRSIVQLRGVQLHLNSDTSPPIYLFDILDATGSIPGIVVYNDIPELGCLKLEEKNRLQLAITGGPFEILGSPLFSSESYEFEGNRLLIRDLRL